MDLRADVPLCSSIQPGQVRQELLRLMGRGFVEAAGVAQSTTNTEKKLYTTAAGREMVERLLHELVVEGGLPAGFADHPIAPFANFCWVVERLSESPSKGAMNVRAMIEARRHRVEQEYKAAEERYRAVRRVSGFEPWLSSQREYLRAEHDLVISTLVAWEQRWAAKLEERRREVDD